MVKQSLMASDKTELFKKLPTLNPAMLDNFLFNKSFCIPNQDYNRGKYSFGTQNLSVYTTNLKAHRLEFQAILQQRHTKTFQFKHYMLQKS